MQFAENLQYLRKQQNLTQEQLAEKLGVSRQAVSKWESAQSYPEMDKLLSLCELFDCNIDVLVQGDVCNATKTDDEGYDALYNRASFWIAFGVALILFGVTMLLFISTFSESALAVVVLLLCIAVAVFLFIYFGIQLENFQKKHMQIEDFYSEEQKERFNRKFAIGIAGGVGLIILGVVLLIVLSETGVNGALAAALLLLCITIAVFFFVYLGMQEEKYDIAAYNRQHNSQSKKQVKADKICGVVMLAATAIFLILGFIWGMWHPGWAVFPIAGIFCAIVSTILED